VNFTFRLQLRAPYKGDSTLVMKHGKPYVRGLGKDITFAFEHQVAIGNSPFDSFILFFQFVLNQA